jgi:Domain of unknown function (DUF4294)
MKPYFFLTFLFITASTAYSQVVTGRGKPDVRQEPSDTYGTDTLAFSLQPITIYSPRVFKNKRLQNQYNRLVRHVKKVYPYAKKASIVLKEEETKMVGMDKSDRKAHMKQVEKRIEKEFGGELKDLNFTQGRILLKLIDRETGYTSYELVDELRGSFRAWFYDGIAGLFGYDLKGEYDIDKNVEDKYIEEVVRMIETGQLSLK